MPVTKKLPTIANVTPGGRFVLTCPVGLSYGKVMFKMGGTTFDESHLSNIDVKINGKVVQEFATGARLVQLNSYYGRPDNTADGFLSVHFRRPELNPQWRALPALGTADVDTLTIEGDIAAGASADLTLTAEAELYPAAPLGAFIKVREFPVSWPAGQYEWDSIPKGPRLVAAHLMDNDFTDAEMDLDGFKVFEGDKDQIQAFQEEAEGKPRVPTAAMTSIDFLLSGEMGDALVTSNVQDRRIRATKSAAAAADIVLEMLDGFQGI